MPRLAQSRALTLPRLALQILLFPFVVIGVLMLGVVTFGALALITTLLARIFN
jgi:hypothetical protein